jgi:hypothetical protein
MKIKNINGYSAEDLIGQAGKGARFVHFSYTLSFIFASVKKTSDVYIIKPSEKASRKGLSFTLLSLIFGWWSLSGPKNTIASIRTNLKGGKDMTDEVTSILEGHLLFRESQKGVKVPSNNF